MIESSSLWHFKAYDVGLVAGWSVLSHTSPQALAGWCGLVRAVGLCYFSHPVSMDEKRSNTQNNKKNISPVLWTDSFQDVSRKVLKKNRKNFSLLSNLEKFITFLPI